MADGNLVTVASKKLKALQEGLLTDVVFLVGENDETAEEIWAVKFDLTVSSMFFANLFNSPLTLKCDGKIRLKNIEPQVFKLIVEFTHLSGHLLSEVDSLDTCLKLAAAADEYMIDDLTALCSKLLEDKFLAVDNVWTVLSKNFRVDTISSACLKFLGSKANVCLKHPSFLEASEEAVKLFYNLDEMSIESESELLSACLRYIKTKENQREVFRQCCLPGLRLLALDSADLVKVFPMLTLEEKTSIVTWKSPLMAAEKPQLAAGLCPISKRRSEIMKITGEQTLILVPDSHVLGVRDVFLTKSFIKSTCNGGLASLALFPKRNIRICGFELFNALNINEEIFQDSAETNKDEGIAKITANVNNCSSMPYPLSTDVKVPENLPLNGWSFVNHSALVPAGGSFTLWVYFKCGSVFRTQQFTEHLVKSVNSSAAFDVFSKIGIANSAELSEHLETKFPADTKLCIIKSIQFTEI
ncbi:uncharacterized protein LOC135936325 [Cloeon dipterum]|uniref:uncharacterized protein LOC135936325 n=1 Tax=Cloeon dipterum TaxID=197152 RepID=UPI0032200313